MPQRNSGDLYECTWCTMEFEDYIEADMHERSCPAQVEEQDDPPAGMDIAPGDYLPGDYSLTHCRAHGYYIGYPSGPDYLCPYCEAGE